MDISTDESVFEHFIKQLLHHCGRWPEPKSVLVMDNAPFHRTKQIEEMCPEAGVKLVCLPPYSPDVNPNKEFFEKLRVFIRRHWQSYEENPDHTAQKLMIYLITWPISLGWHG
jgi:transposase